MTWDHPEINIIKHLACRGHVCPRQDTLVLDAEYRFKLQNFLAYFLSLEKSHYLSPAPRSHRALRGEPAISARAVTLETVVAHSSRGSCSEHAATVRKLFYLTVNCFSLNPQSNYSKKIKFKLIND